LIRDAAGAGYRFDFKLGSQSALSFARCELSQIDEDRKAELKEPFRKRRASLI